MATTETRLKDLAQAVGTQDKILKVLINGNAADLSSLTFGSKTNLMSALNELKTYADSIQAAAGAAIDDAATSSTTKTYSINKIKSLIDAALAGLIDGAPGLLDTIKELATAIGNDPNFVTTITTALSKRVRFDAAQTLTAAEKVQVKANIDAYGAAELGNPDVDLVAVFNAALT